MSKKTFYYCTNCGKKFGSNKPKICLKCNSFSFEEIIKIRHNISNILIKILYIQPIIGYLTIQFNPQYSGNTLETLSQALVTDPIKMSLLIITLVGVIMIDVFYSKIGFFIVFIQNCIRIILILISIYLGVFSLLSGYLKILFLIDISLPILYITILFIAVLVLKKDGITMWSQMGKRIVMEQHGT
jgi:DNA-directed RNA polymerase subunit RPC12/RpoP